MKTCTLVAAVCAVHSLLFMPAYSQSLERQERIDALERETQAIHRKLEALSGGLSLLVQVEETVRWCLAGAKSFCECISRTMPSDLNFSRRFCRVEQSGCARDECVKP
jgi:hypothetical protein